jgi:hypothetical protein
MKLRTLEKFRWSAGWKPALLLWGGNLCEGVEGALEELEGIWKNENEEAAKTLDCKKVML